MSTVTFSTHPPWNRVALKTSSKGIKRVCFAWTLLVNGGRHSVLLRFDAIKSHPANDHNSFPRPVSTPDDSELGFTSDISVISWKNMKIFTVIKHLDSTTEQRVWTDWFGRLLIWVKCAIKFVMIVSSPRARIWQSACLAIPQNVVLTSCIAYLVSLHL